MFKKKTTFNEILHQAKFDNKLEQDLVNAALYDLQQGMFEERVRKNLSRQFSNLALEKKISVQGLKFYQELNSGSDINGSAKLFSFFGH